MKSNFFNELRVRGWTGKKKFSAPYSRIKPTGGDTNTTNIIRYSYTQI